MVRLDAQVSSLFGVKQSEARALIASGEVSVNGAPQREPRWQVVLGEEASAAIRCSRSGIASLGPSSV